MVAGCGGGRRGSWCLRRRGWGCRGDLLGSSCRPAWRKGERCSRTVAGRRAGPARSGCLAGREADHRQPRAGSMSVGNSGSRARSGASGLPCPNCIRRRVWFRSSWTARASIRCSPAIGRACRVARCAPGIRGIQPAAGSSRADGIDIGALLRTCGAARCGPMSTTRGDGAVAPFTLEWPGLPRRSTCR